MDILCVCVPFVVLFVVEAIWHPVRYRIRKVQCAAINFEQLVKDSRRALREQYPYGGRH